DAQEEENDILISVKNISKDQLNISPDELMERFVRGDSSRHTEGSGLGLNIANSLAEIMHGSLKLTIDGDLFKTELRLPK
ncbi:MAG: GHKL domain-containing protein, partial [Erysipelotrichaceae bacterium]|nr:GHKL domain-containing protein [Erysipelotrichaceae bacterium]